MPRDSARLKKPSLHYPTIVISDLHLGKRKVVEAGLLLEFLEHTTSDTLILNGDIIDGWYLEKHKHRPFPEMHARVMDAINRKAAEGTRVIFIPGNHDERLRYTSRAEMERLRLEREKPNFYREVTFRTRGSNYSSTIEFVSDMVIKDGRGRNMRVLHGDVFDPPWVSGSLSVVGDQFYDALVVANTAFSELSKRFNGGTRFSFAKLVKKNTKDAVGIIKNFETAASDLPDHIDGMICGHIHHAEITENNGKLYVNSGDWIESCTSAVQDKDGNWDIFHWEEERIKLGLCGNDMYSRDNPNPEFRGITEKQLRLAQYLWPARNRAKMLGKRQRGKLDGSELVLIPA
jgi:UDP-2,3-diacylglucosamine pyrophosphatase LpxH